MKKASLIIYVTTMVFAVSFSANAQQQNLVDSLSRLLVNAKDTTRVNVLNNLCWELRNSKPDEAIKYGREALSLAAKLSYPSGLVRGYNRVGVILMNQGMYDTAKSYFLVAVDIAGKSGNLTGKASTLMNMGNIAYYQANFDEAVEHFIAATKIYEELNDKQGIANCNTNASNIYFTKGDYGKAIEYLKNALRVYTEMGLKEEQGFCFDNLGVMYSTMGDFSKALQHHFMGLKIFEEVKNMRQTAMSLSNIGSLYYDQKNYNDALPYFFKSLKLNEEQNSKREILACLYNIGMAYHYLDSPSLALSNLNRSLTIAEEIKDLEHIANSQQGLGVIYHKQKDKKAAIAHYKSALALNRKLEKKPAIISLLNNLSYLYGELGQTKQAMEAAQESYQLSGETGSRLLVHESSFALSAAFKKAGNYAKALEYFESASRIKDSVFNEDKSRELGRVESAHELDKKDQEINLLNKDKLVQEANSQRQQTVRNGLIGGLFLILLLAFVLIRNNRQKQHTNQLLTAQKKEIEINRDNLENALTNLKETQSQLVQREKMASLGELTAGIAHEIQNPLNFVNNFAEVNRDLIDELKTELKAGNHEDAIAIADDIADNEEKINEHGKRADGIVKSMLQHSRINSGQKDLTDITALADEYFRLSFHGLRAKDKNFNVKLETSFDQEHRIINIVPQDIGRVLLNLYNNAFYAVMEKKKTAGESYEPVISVTTKTVDGETEIRIADNGNGIPENISEKIFQPFFTTKPTGQGTGLGLSLSYDIITKGHAGDIRIESTENVGTTVIISLPNRNTNLTGF